jgi:hypothetical protein
VQSATNIAENALQCDEVGLSRIMHVKTDLLHIIGYIWPGEGEVLQCSCQAAKISWVSKQEHQMLQRLSGWCR